MIGAKRERVRIIRRTRVKDANGDYAIAETTIAERWAKIEPVTGREIEHAGQLRGVMDYHVSVDLYGAPIVLADDRALWLTRGDIDLNIREVRLASVRALDTVLICEAGTADGPSAP